jgi:hypothetical protein
MDTFETALSEIIQTKTEELATKVLERERIKKELREAAVNNTSGNNDASTDGNI